MTRLQRRNFLKVTVVSAGAFALPACGDDDEPLPSQAEVFPQGVASGDPTPATVMLWTRALGDGAVEVQVEIASDEAFASPVASGSATATVEGDHCVRYRVEGLSPYTTYYYRFTARGVTSPVGRTKTAPGVDQDVAVRFAFAACQDFVGRYYHSWRALLEEPEVDFVAFLGDYIYETNGDPEFQTPGAARSITLPDGKVVSEDGSEKAALTVADYRALYQQYRSDPQLQEVHRRYPFLVVWDDHEFCNDCWQDHSTDFDEAEGPEQDTPRRQAATQAFFEYQPIDVSYDAAAGYPDDIRIYRSLRFGKHLEMFLTDGRYYRDDHLIPEGPSNPAVGKIGENTSLGARNFLLKSGFDPLEASGRPTLLGDAQRDWLVNGISDSNATWKFWAGDLQLAQQAIDLSSFDMLPEQYQGNFYLSVDQWDGYRSERFQILQALDGVANLVTIAGDIHGFYASELQVDFDAPAATPMAVEFVVAGITSLSFKEEIERTLAGDEILSTLGLLELVPMIDQVLLATNPHYRFSDTGGYGIAVVDVDKDVEVRVTFLRIADPTSPDYAGVAERVEMRTAAGSNRIVVS